MDASSWPAANEERQAGAHAGAYLVIPAKAGQRLHR